MKEKSIRIIKKLKYNGFMAAWVGGCVRDMLMNRQPNDYDIATNATPDDIERLFGNAKFVGNQFGVSLVDGIEVATFRMDGNYEDGRRPEFVEFCSMEDDALRRDFTINAMFYDPIDEKLYDFHNGEEDLKNGVIRFVGNSYKRIDEDHLRIMRAIRFASRFNFQIDKESEKAMFYYMHKLESTSIERIYIEINKMFKQSKSKDVAKGLSMMHTLGFMNMFIPEFSNCVGCEQPREFHPEGDVSTHLLATVQKLPNDSSVELYWAAFLHDIGKPKVSEYSDEKERYTFNGHDVVSAEYAEEILKRFKSSNETIVKVKSLIENHMKFMNAKDMKKSTLLKFIAQDYFDEMLELHKTDLLSASRSLDTYDFIVKKLNSFESEYKVKKKIVLPEKLLDGYDLMNIGFKPGPIFREILDDVYDRQLQGEFKTSEQCLNYVKFNYFIA